VRGVLPPAPADRSPEAYRALIERYFQAIARAKGGER
jgi:hypothetical protein